MMSMLLNYSSELTEDEITKIPTSVLTRKTDEIRSAATTMKNIKFILMKNNVEINEYFYCIRL